MDDKNIWYCECCNGMEQAPAQLRTRQFVVSAVIGRADIDNEDSDEPQSVGRYLSTVDGTYAWVEESAATTFPHMEEAYDALHDYLRTAAEIIDGIIYADEGIVAACGVKEVKGDE